jgi:hypothetical protein
MVLIPRLTMPFGIRPPPSTQDAAKGASLRIRDVSREEASLNIVGSGSDASHFDLGLDNFYSIKTNKGQILSSIPRYPALFDSGLSAGRWEFRWIFGQALRMDRPLCREPQRQSATAPIMVHLATV